VRRKPSCLLWARSGHIYALDPKAGSFWFADRPVPNRRIVTQALLLRALGKRQSRHSVANIRDADLRSNDFASRRSRHDANVMQQPKLVRSLKRSQRASNVFRRFVHGPQTPNYHLGRHQRGLIGIHANVW
jgi:hypothetical protein